MIDSIMRNTAEQLRKYREQITYVMCGAATTFVNWAVYVVALLFIPLAVSNLLAWFIAVAFAFLMNRNYVFRSGKKNARGILTELLLFYTARIVSGVFEVAGLPLVVFMGIDQQILGVDGAMAKAIISVIVIVSNYFFSKFVVFKKEA